MSEQIKQRPAEKTQTEEEASTPTPVRDKHQKLKDDLDAVLDSIDDVLVENAADFVAGFTQKGGE